MVVDTLEKISSWNWDGWSRRRRISTCGKLDPVNDKAPLLVILLIILVIGLLAPLHANVPEKIKLPGFARSLRWSEAESLLVTSMALNGIAFLQIEDGKVVASEFRKDWPTLDSIPIREGRHLLADRFNKLRLIEVKTPASKGDPIRVRELAVWETDVIATNLAWDGQNLLVAGGGAGVQSYKWDGSEEEPVLRGRYPFVDYSKEINLSADGNILYLADNLDTGLQILNVTDPRRMVRLLQRSGDFVDSLSRHNDLLAVTYRHSGVEILDVSNPEFPRVLTQIPVSQRTMETHPTVLQVRFDSEGRVFVCENDRGARYFALIESTSGVVPDLLWELPRSAGSAGSVVFLPGGRLALCSLDGTLTIHQPDLPKAP